MAILDVKDESIQLTDLFKTLEDRKALKLNLDSQLATVNIQIAELETKIEALLNTLYTKLSDSRLSVSTTPTGNITS